LLSIKVLYQALHVNEVLILGVGAAASLLAMVVLCRFDEKIDLQNMKARGLVVYGDPPK